MGANDNVAQSRERLIYLDSTVVGTAPAQGTEPHIVLSAYTANGKPTQGFSIALVPPTADAAEVDIDQFDITPYRLCPTLGGLWLRCATYQGAEYLDQLVCYDFGAGTGLYFVVTPATGGVYSTPGTILAAIAEQA